MSRNLSSRSAIDSIRKSPQNTFGDNTENGAFHCVDEIITNSRDEAEEGHCSKISVTAYDDGSFLIEDNGRGLPMDWNEGEQKYNWELACCTLNASGKYDASQYGGAAGLNGLGLTATNFASEYMKVESCYGGKRYKVEFVKGETVGEMIVEDIPDAVAEETHGTKVEFKPDMLVFPALRIKKIPLEPLYDLCRSYAMLIPGLQIDVMTYEVDEPITFKYDNGVVDYINELPIRGKIIKDTKLYTGTYVGTDDEVLYPETYELHAGVAFNFSHDVGMVEAYHNGIRMFELKGNDTLDAIKNAAVSAFMYYGQQTGKCTKKTNITFRDIEDVMVCIGYTSCPGYRTWFKHQTKGAIHNPFIVKSFSQLVFNSIMEWATEDTVAADKVLKIILDNVRAREESEKVRKSVINKLTKPVTFTDQPKKLTDCKSTDTSENEVYIVEGDSAAGTTINARYAKYQAVLGLRGKILNCEKATMDRILMSDIIIEMFRSFGCGVEKGKSKIDLPDFDITKLRYGKIIICTDADIDGSHIRTLVLTAIYRLAPELIRQGKVFIVEAPLFQIDFKYNGETKQVFVYSEDEYQNAIDTITSHGVTKKNMTISRYKGLGEMDKEVMHASTMDKNNRRLIPIEMSKDPEELAPIMSKLMGTDILGRKELIKEYFSSTRQLEI